MTDNVDVTPGTGATIATDDVAGVQYQRVKVDLGGDGAASPLVRGSQTKANSLPVAIASDQTVTVDASGAAVPVTDNGGNLSIDDGGNVISVDDGAGSLTVDGSVTVTQATGTNLHAVIDSGTVSTITNVVHVDDNASTLSVDDGAGSLTVDYATTGSGNATGALRVELANNGTGVLATVGAVTAITNALPAGTNAIGKLAANSGVDIGDVDITSVVPGSGATNLGKAEDGIHGDGDVGVMALAVRKNTAASTSGSDGDYQPLITNTTGHLWVDASGQTLTVGSHAVTNAGTFAVQATIADAADATLGAKADAKSTATDTTAISAMSVLKQISASVQAPPSQAVTNAGTFAVQAAVTAASGSFSSGALSSGSVASGAVASGAFASGSIASGAIASGAIAAGAIAAGATSIAENEDVGSADGDRGVKVLAVRKASPANTSGSDGDYEFLQMSAGRIWASATIDAAIPAGDNLIGRTKLSDGTTVVDVIATPKALKVGIVDGSGTQITSFGGGTQYTEDAAAASDPVGNAVILIRKDTPATQVTTDGDNVAQRGTNYGAAYVQVVTSAGAYIDSFGGGTQYAEDLASSGGESLTLTGVKRQDTPAANANVSADADFTQLIVDNTGQLWIAGSYKEDQAASDGDRGLVQLAKRQDTPAANANVSADADYAPMLVDNLGQLWTAGTYKEDQASADGDRLVVAGAKRNDTPANTSGTDGDYEPLQVSGGRLWTHPIGDFVTITATATKSSTTTTYTIGDCWSDSTGTPVSGGFTFTGAARVSGGSGIITDAMITNSVGPALMLQGEIWLYDSAVTHDADNAAFTNTDSDVLLAVGVIPFTVAASAVGSVSAYAHIQNLNIGFTCVGTANLRFKVKVQNAYVNAASEVLQVRLKILQTN